MHAQSASAATILCVDSSVSPAWCSVRYVFSWQRADERVYEERITLWPAGDLDQAIARVEAEARHCARESNEAPVQAVDYLCLVQSY